MSADRDFDCVVVGGGVAGLTTALRLAHHGYRVGLVEKDQLGSGATTANHGLVHSGALFAGIHPEIAPWCREAQQAYQSAFPCIIDGQWCWYFAGPECLDRHRSAWDTQSIEHQPVDEASLTGVVLARGDRPVRAAAVRELVIDTAAMLADLAARCSALGVTILTAVGDSRIVTGTNRQVCGVNVRGGRISAGDVVLCCGLGSREVLDASGSGVGARLRSRLDMMVTYPNVALPQPVIGLEFGAPALVPAVGRKFVRASWHGAPQPTVERPGRWTVPLAWVARLQEDVTRWFGPAVVDYERGFAWVCSKTEYAGPRTDRWGVNPNYAVIDHSAADGISGLWTVLPGKMTLALHASAAVTAQITRSAEDLTLPRPRDDISRAQEFFVAEPWTAYPGDVTK